MTLVAAAEITALVVGLGGAGTVLQKAVRTLRRFGRFMDGWFGDGTAQHPSVIDRLGAIERKLDDHVDSVAPSLLADGQAWGKRLEESIKSLDQRLSGLEDAQHGSGGPPPL